MNRAYLPLGFDRFGWFAARHMPLKDFIIGGKIKAIDFELSVCALYPIAVFVPFQIDVRSIRVRIQHHIIWSLVHYIPAVDDNCAVVGLTNEILAEQILNDPTLYCLGPSKTAEEEQQKHHINI